MPELPRSALAVLETAQDSFSEKPSEAQPVERGQRLYKRFAPALAVSLPATRDPLMEGDQWSGDENQTSN